MQRLVIIRRGKRHCTFTRACVNEQLGPMYRIPGTQVTLCGQHAKLVSMLSHNGGAAGSELAARVNLAPAMKRGGS